MIATESISHLLAVAVRVTDHFVGTAVPDELDVRIDGQLPSTVRGGTGRRHADGTYRFIDLDLPAVPHAIAVVSKDGRWMALEPAPPLVFPIAHPTEALDIPMWPTTKQATPLGMTSLRGKLVGAPAATVGQRIEVDVGLADTGHHTRSESFADFLFLLPGRLDLDLDGHVPLAVRVVGRTITGGELISGEHRTPFSGPSFAIDPGRETHVRLFVT